MPKDLEIHPLPRTAHKTLMFGELTVSIRPDCIVKKKIRGVTRMGFVKIHLSQANTLSVEQMSVVGAVLQEYAKSHEFNETPGHPDLFYVIDVFGECPILSGPKSTSKRLGWVNDAAEEICDRWPLIKRKAKKIIVQSGDVESGEFETSELSDLF